MYNKTDEKACFGFFLKHYSDLTTETPQTLKEVRETCVKVQEKMREDMDGLPVEIEVSDHYLHWIALVKLGDFEQEIPLQLVSHDELQISTVRMFLTQLMDLVINQLPEQPMTPEYLRSVADLLEEARSSCYGCARSFSVQEMVYTQDGFTVNFSVNLGGKLHLTFPLSRTYNGIVEF